MVKKDRKKIMKHDDKDMDSAEMKKMMKSMKKKKMK